LQEIEPVLQGLDLLLDRGLPIVREIGVIDRISHRIQLSGWLIRGFGAVP
jgi:hypothetical protein